MSTGLGFAADVTIEAHGLRIVKPSPNGDMDLRAFNWSPGTTVSLLISSPNGGLIDLDRDSAKITSFVDNKGNDLTKAEVEDRFGMNKVKFGMMPNISDDGRFCSAEVTAPGVPGKGATSLTISGEVVLQAATQKKDFVAENVALKKGTKIEGGPMPLEITHTGKPNWSLGNTKFSVRLQAKENFENMDDIQFFDSNGDSLEAKRMSTTTGTGMGMEWEYGLNSEVDTAKVVITYWTDMRMETVPFDLTIDMGL